MKTLKQSILSIAIGLALVAGISFAEWQGAQDNPPKSNASAPVNVGDSGQIKTGSLGVNGFKNIGKSVFDGNVGIGTIVETDNLFEIKASNSYINKDTFSCGIGSTAISYKTEAETCGRNAGKCTEVTTGSHDWSATGKYQESATYIGGGDCKTSKTCLATPLVKCSTPPAPLFKVVSEEGLFITDGTQGKGKVLTSDAGGKANWASSRIKITETGLYNRGSGSLGFHNYCALARVQDASGEDSTYYAFYVLPGAYDSNTGKYNWGYYIDGYQAQAAFNCFDFNN